MNQMPFIAIFIIAIDLYVNLAISEEISDNVVKNSIIGIWSMIPLKNGIANVVEYTKDGKSKVYSFNCIKKNERVVEISDYKVSQDGKIIYISSEKNSFELEVLTLQPKAMKLSMNFNDHKLTFQYIKTNKIEPLCSLFKWKEPSETKKGAFDGKEFIHKPIIPIRPDIDRYIGAWANDKGEIQITIIKDADGNIKLHLESDKNWNYLYNNVSWVGNELHYQSFAYSDKKDLFTHPYHKSRMKTIITPVSDYNKIKYSFFIDSSRYDYILTRK
ncbi:hypothetical protein [Spartinivicinus poritis]|uniref:Uncharacterized protein n=1 Tax=Spartinivicinus poritis TaxID=2994640 RepID=A0ABT5UBF6_9GAMM|nr:hypothetical protein [Spartinivicinus sp. A2-2]MDE1463714.1 hypothetical protein [Spartinivicinus sp. A2-2]